MIFRVVREALFVRSIFSFSVALALLTLPHTPQAEARRSKKIKAATTEFAEPRRPENMLGYSEIMRLKPAKRELYLQRIADMLVDVEYMPSDRPFRIIFDARKYSSVSRTFDAITWQMLLFPYAHAASNNCTLSQATDFDFFGIPEKKVNATNCTWNEQKGSAACPAGYYLVNLPNSNRSGQQGCVKESDLRKSLGTKIIDDWEKAKGQCDQAKSKTEGPKEPTKKETEKKDGRECIYAGFVGKTKADGLCPRPDGPLTVEVSGGKKFVFSCPPGGGTVVCNPAIFGVVAVDPADSNKFTAVCVDPSVNATRNCRALSLKFEESKANTKPEDNLSNPIDMAARKTAQGEASKDSFQKFRADPTATNKLFLTDGFADMFNETGTKIGGFCSNSNENGQGNNMYRFCIECESMAEKMKRAHDEAQGAGPGGPQGGGQPAAR